MVCAEVNPVTGSVEYEYFSARMTRPSWRFSVKLPPPGCSNRRRPYSLARHLQKRDSVRGFLLQMRLLKPPRLLWRRATGAATRFRRLPGVRSEGAGASEAEPTEAAHWPSARKCQSSRTTET